jgi:hypothetical protein
MRVTFDIQYLPAIFKDLIKETSEFSAADPILVVTALISSISGYLKTAHCLPKGEYFQDLYPVVWVLTVLESGGFKSTGLNLGSRIAWDKHNLIMEEIYEAEQKLLNEKGKKATLDGYDRDEAFQILQREDVVLPSLSTPQGLLQDLSRGLGGTIFHDEFAVWLSNMEKQYNAGLKSLFTTLFDVPERFETKTAGKGTLRIRRPFVNICAVSAVDWIKKQIQPSDVESGFFARFLLFCPVKKNEISDALPQNKDFSGIQQKEEAIKKIVEVVSSERRLYKLSAEAEKRFLVLHRELNDYVTGSPSRTRAIIGPYAKRWSPYILKLAMILQPFFEAETPSLKRDCWTIGSQALRGAVSIVEYSMQSTVYLFEEELGISEHQQKCKTVLKYIGARKGCVVRRALLGSRILGGGVKDYDYVLQTLQETGQLIKVHSESGGIKNDEYRLSSLSEFERI